MSAANYYQPHIYIDGAKLIEAAPADGLAAVADFTITWGAKDWFSNVEPARLDLTLLDPYGELIALAKQQRIEVRRDPSNELVFLGSIDDVESAYGETTDPRTGERRTMWRHKIRAYDPLAALARDRRRGPEYLARDIAPYRLHWGPCYMTERKMDFERRSPVPVAWEPSLLDQYDGVTPILIFPVSAYERQQVVSLLTVLRNTARITDPFNRPYYFPSEEQIRFVKPGDPSSGLTNIEAGPGILMSTKVDDGRHVLLSGFDIAAADGVKASTALREQVTRLELTTRATKPTTFVSTDTSRYMENVEESIAIDAVPRAGQQMTVQYESDFSAAFWYTAAEVRAGQSAFLAMHYIHGSASLGPLKYRFDKHAAAPPWALPLLSPAPPLHNGAPIVYHLVNSLTNWIPNARPFSVLGGVLRYTHRYGWEIEMHPSPVGTADGRPTLGDIKTRNRIEWVWDRTTVADWQHLDFAQ